MRAPASVFCTEQTQEPTIIANQRSDESALPCDHHTNADECLLLTTVAGAADLLAADLRSVGATSISVVDDASVSCRFHGSVSAFTTIGILGSVGIALDDATAALPDLTPILGSLHHGILGELDLDSPLRFRVAVPGPQQRRAVIAAVQDQTGWANDPADWQLNVTRRGHRWVAEIGRLHYSRRFGRLRRQPWSTNPVLAGILVRLAKIRPGHVVHDPFCGTGTLLIAALQAASSLRLSGTDHDRGTIELARANLDDHRSPAIVSYSDAIPIPQAAGTIDRIISNLPFGKQVGSHRHNVALYPALTGEIARTLRIDGRAILLTEDKRLLVDAVSSTPGVKIIRQRLLRYNGASPTAYTIARTRAGSLRRQ